MPASYQVHPCTRSATMRPKSQSGEVPSKSSRKWSSWTRAASAAGQEADNSPVRPWRLRAAVCDVPDIRFVGDHADVLADAQRGTDLRPTRCACAAQSPRSSPDGTARITEKPQFRTLTRGSKRAAFGIRTRDTSTSANRICLASTSHPGVTQGVMLASQSKPLACDRSAMLQCNRDCPSPTTVFRVPRRPQVLEGDGDES